MFELSEMPYIPGQETRPIVEVSGDALKKVGENSSAFAMHVGDKISFPEGDPLVVSQKVDPTRDALVYYVACERNGRKSWLTIGALTRLDVHGKPVGKFQEEMRKFANFADMYASALAGKSITSKRAEDKEFAVFEDGVRTDKTRTRATPIIEWA